MPKHLIPHRTGAHRIAAIALFRALLTQCKALQLPAQQSTEAQNIIRNRFKGQRHVTGYRQLTVSFTAGYEALDHLDAAVAGNKESKDYLLDLVEKAHLSAKQTPPPPPWVQKQIKEQERKEKARKEREARDALKIDLFSRPLPLEKLSGRRHIPVLFSANRIPVLRLKKPQPQHLSAYLNSRIELRQKRQDRKDRLEAELRIANEEDKWESFLHQNTGVDSRDGEHNVTWRDEVKAALNEVTGLLETERKKNREMAEKMQAVVDRETELYMKEKAEKKKRKSEENWARKRERRQAEEGEAVQEGESPKEEGG